MSENAEAWELLQAAATQLRMSGVVGPIVFVYTALALVAEALGVDLTPGLWKKVRAVETVLRANAEKHAQAVQKSP